MITNTYVAQMLVDERRAALRRMYARPRRPRRRPTA
jgi:hypothetical protein